MAIINVTVPAGWRGRLDFMGVKADGKKIPLGSSVSRGDSTSVKHIVYTFKGDVSVRANGGVFPAPFKDHDPMTVTIAANATDETVVPLTLSAVTVPPTSESAAAGSGGSGGGSTGPTTISNVTGLQSTLDSKWTMPTNGTTGQFSRWNGTTFAPAWISISDIYQMQSTLDTLSPRPAAATGAGKFHKWSGTAWVEDTLPAGGGGSSLQDVITSANTTSPATRRLADFLNQGVGTLTLGLVGDSTSAFDGTSHAVMIRRLMTRYPNMTVEIHKRNDLPGPPIVVVMPAKTTLQTGAQLDAGAILDQTFNTVVADLNNTAIGNASATRCFSTTWKTNGAGGWASDANGMYATAISKTIGAYVDRTNGLKASFTLNFANTTTPSAASELYYQLSSSEYPNSWWGISFGHSNADGSVTMSFKNSTGTLTRANLPTGLTANSATAQTLAVTATLSNRLMTVTLSANGGAALTYTYGMMWTREQTGAGKHIGFRSSITGSVPVAKIANFKLEHVACPAFLLRFLHASKAGTNMADFNTNRARLIPAVNAGQVDVAGTPGAVGYAVDVMMVHYGHNYLENTFQNAMKSEYDSFSTNMANEQPDALVCITTQNPRHSEAKLYWTHIERQQAVREYALSKGWSVLPMMEYVMATKTPNEWNAYFSVDTIPGGTGVHAAMQDLTRIEQIIIQGGSTPSGEGYMADYLLKAIMALTFKGKP